MQPPAPTGVKHESYLKARLPSCWKPVLNPETNHRMRLMCSPPNAHGFMFVIVKGWMTCVPVMFMMIVTIVTILPESRSTRDNKKCSGAHR